MNKNIIKNTLIGGIAFFVSYTFFSINNIDWKESILYTLVFMVIEFITFLIISKAKKK